MGLGNVSGNLYSSDWDSFFSPSSSSGPCGLGPASIGKRRTGSCYTSGTSDQGFFFDFLTLSEHHDSDTGSNHANGSTQLQLYG